MIDVVSKEHLAAASMFRELLASYKDAEDLINLGAYARGSNPLVDEAIDRMPEMNAFLKQGIQEQDTFDNIVNRLQGLFKKKESAAPSKFRTIAQMPNFLQGAR
jgi:flagellum-specific ATP synthase